MKTMIENQFLSVESTAQGAELTSIRLKSDGTQYLWQGDPKFWKGQSPLLFPVVCAVADSQYTYLGKKYPMKNHGFARSSEFETVHESSEKIIYRLQANAETLACYPFLFTLEVGYTLEGSTLAVSYRVVNRDDKEMYFSIGAHPGFNCPLDAGDSFEDYYLEFSEIETLDRHFLNAANLQIAGKSEPFLRNENIKPMQEGMFASGAFVLDGVKSTSVALKGKKTKKSVTVSFPGFPQLGIWAANGAPYVCIEPWYGIAEATDFSGDLTQMDGMLKLASGGVFESVYRIIIS